MKKIKMSLTTISILSTSASAIEIASPTHAVDIAGKQRMFTQRMLKDYAMKLFKVSLAELEKSSLNTDEIKALLSKVKRSFMFFEMMSKSKSKFVPTLIYKKSNDILVNMNSATQKYVALETK